MEITFILPELNLSGGTRVIATQAAILSEFGHTVNIVSPDVRPYSIRERLRAIRSGQGWLPRRHSDFTYFNGLKLRMKVLQPYRCLMEDDIPDADVVIATFWSTAEFVARLAPCKGVKAFFIQGYETLPGQYSSEIDSAWRLPLHKIVVSKWLQMLAAERFGDANVSYVPNGVDRDLFSSEQRSRNAVSTVGFLYSTAELKGSDVAIEVLEALRMLVPELRIVSFGAEPQDKTLPFPEKTEFVCQPPQRKLREIYGMCDVWLSTSRQEGFCLPPLEALSCGTPVVATRVGATPEMIKDGVNGFLTNVDDLADLVEKTMAILNRSSEEWCQMSSRSEEIAAGFSCIKSAKLFEAALQNLVS